MALNAHGGSGRMDGESETFVVPPLRASMRTAAADGNHTEADSLVAHSLRGEGFDASEDGTGRGTPLITHALPAMATGGSVTEDGTGRGVPLVAFQDRFRGDDGRGYDRPPPISEEITGALETVKPWNVAVNFEHGLAAHGSMETSDTVASLTESEYKGHTAVITSAVRRLTPRECERLQGFPDDYTLIQYRGKPAADGPRYRALGNSMAVPVVRWIGARIAAEDAGLFG